MDEDSEHLVQHGTTAADKVQDPEDNEVDRGSPWTIEAVDESDTNELSSYVSFISSSQNRGLTLNAL